MLMDKFDVRKVDELTKEDIRIHAAELLTWLQDINWPVAMPLAKKLRDYEEYTLPYIAPIFTTDDYIWQRWVLQELVVPMSDKKALESVLWRLVMNPKEEEKEEELDQLAMQALGIIGLTGRINNTHGFELQKLLTAIDGQEWTWLVADNEAYQTANNTLVADLFETSMYSYEELVAVLQAEHYVIFLDLKAFAGQPLVVNTYADFEHTNCTLVLLVIDAEDIAVYAKDYSHLTAIAGQLTNVEFVTKKSDMRTILGY